MQRRTFLQTATAATVLPRTFAITQPARTQTLRFVPQANLPTLLDPIFTTAVVHNQSRVGNLRHAVRRRRPAGTPATNG